MNPEHRGQTKGRKSYWSRNLKRLWILLFLWFLGSYGVGILFVDEMDQISFFGFKLGFWFAQQGSIYVFLLLILAYVRTMNALDDEYADAPKTQDDAADEEVE